MVAAQRGREPDESETEKLPVPGISSRLFRQFNKIRSFFIISIVMSAFNNSRYSIGAGLIYTMLGEPLENWFINVIENRIESFTSRPTQDEIYDFGGDCVILPGTVNMHAHLELSQLDRPLDVPVDEKNGRRPMADWVSKLMEFRRSENYDARTAVWNALLRPEVLSESVAVADIVSLNFRDDETMKPKLPAWFRFIELIAWNKQTANEKLLQISDCLQKNEAETPIPQPVLPTGLSPHAPQTVCPTLLGDVVELAKKRSCSIAMHLAETPEEIEFLQTGDGPLLDMMRKADPDYDPRTVLLGGSKPTRILDYLKLLSEAPKVFVIHGNYLNDEELKFLADRRETMSVVYCPRSHAYFTASNENEKYPLHKMLDLGVNVLLGTDSLASVPDLSIINEIKFVLRQHPEIPPKTLFLMGTVFGAEALGLEADFGTLEEGKTARFSFLFLKT